MEIFAHPERFIQYNGQFLYPPRAEYRIQPLTIDKFDNGQYIGQPKLDGSATSVTISKDGFVAKERHNTFFAIPPKFDFRSLHRGSGFMCIAGEFMNKSKKDHTDRPLRGFCIWDILAYNNQILIGSSVEERWKLIHQLYPATEAVSIGNVDYLIKTETADIYKVNNFYDNFVMVFKELIKIDAIEGCVLKRKNGQMEMMNREMSNASWAVKVRRPTHNYRF